VVHVISEFVKTGTVRLYRGNFINREYNIATKFRKNSKSEGLEKRK